jgi:RNA polymerase sigma factor (sigma-70 family)
MKYRRPSHDVSLTDLNELLYQSLRIKDFAGEVTRTALNQLKGRVDRRAWRLGMREDDRRADLWQDVMVTLLELARKGETPKSPASYALGIAQRRVMQTYRDRYRQAVPSGGMESVVEDTPGDAWLRQFPDEIRGLALKGLDQLPPRERAIASLRIFLDWTFAEIAAAIRIPISTVHSTFFRAMAKVKRSVSAGG